MEDRITAGVGEVPRRHRMSAVAGTSIGFGGQNTAVVLATA
ncbi:hypothetical protein [Streptomyces sp. NPDC051662]